MPISLTSKLPEVKTTIFTVMSQLSAQHNAINLSQGFPGFDPPQELIDRVVHHLNAGHNQYAPMAGPVLLRERIAEKIQRLYGAKLDTTSEITATSGATEGLFAAIASIVHPGDEVIVFDPAYDSYVPAIELAGGVARHIKLCAPHYRIDWNRVESTLSNKTRLIIVNSPHNPTGTTLARADLDSLAQLLRRYNTLVLSDEVYQHIVFDGAEHQSVLRHPELRERSFAVSSFGKTYHATGWKAGYCIAPPALTRELRKVHQYLTFCASTPLLFALADYLENSAHYLNLGAFYQAKRDYFLDRLKHSRFRFTPCEGTYFQLLDYSAISDTNDVEYARKLTADPGVASIPVSVFNADLTDDKVLRFCFAKNADTLARAAELLCKI